MGEPAAGRLTAAEQQDLERARQLLTETELLQGRGKIVQLSGSARILAHAVIQLTQRLEQERSARQAIQAERDRLRPGAS
jgi:hypothetical protein